MSTIVKFGPADHDRVVTEEELAHARWQEGYRYEIIDGRIYVSPIPNMPHDLLVIWIRDALRDYSRLHPEVINLIPGESKVVVPDVPEQTAPEPDAAAYANIPRHRSLRDYRWEDYQPLIVVEVISEDDPDKDLVRNVELYLHVPGIREYWILDPRPDPDEPALYVFRRRGSRWQKRIDVPFGSEYTTRLLPGFRLVVDPHQEPTS